eukprot:scaffold34462_cov56-Phaeocystis_antarctica.AAC.5
MRAAESRKGGIRCGARCGPGGGRAADDRGARNVQGRARLQIWGRARGGAHEKHVSHGCDAGGVPVGYIRVEVQTVVIGIVTVTTCVTFLEELAHVGDGRDVPVGDGPVRRYGGSRVSVELLDRRHQGGLGRESRAGSRTPARAIASGGEGRGSLRPADSQKEAIPCGARCEGQQAAGVRGARSGTRGGAHLEHVAHVHDAGGVEAQRLAERRRVLPRVERRAYGAGRGCGPADGRPACGSKLDCRLGARRGDERT